ncbi:selenide, water dikinase SelD [Streptomyces sp. NPDC092129]|uniref:selenide, water dikinase SelD n=1 Tax=Streptomyces sp. NPDC092129 TaxID=3366010 RepID=UPI00381DEFF4
MTSQEAVPLTQYSPGGGCACKMPQRLLNDVLSTMHGDSLLAAVSGPLRVGMDPADDAAVYDLDGRSLVFTCDFLTPVVDDPYDWGRIAATNALSDVYAMGGRPLVALNILAWPADLDREMLAEVMHGGARAVADAGALLAGGHSITDPAPKYGLAVVGDVDRDTILLKGGGRAGDVLVLTKPLGAGVVGTAVKRGEADPATVRAAVQTMTRLNADAAAVARTAQLSGGTDVTGYGLLGHLHEMAFAAGVAARVQPGEVPLLPGVADLIERGCAPDGTRRTLVGALKEGWFDPGPLPHSGQILLADAQTSGGLLLAVEPDRADTVVAHLRDRGDRAAAIVGDLVAGAPGTVSIHRGRL